MAQRTFDIVLYGATGFTGSIVAQYLAKHPQQPKLAFAGRNKAKLQGVVDKLTDVPDSRKQSIGLIEANANDSASLHRMAAQAKTIINTVGPYSQLGGLDVIKAAIDEGIGYVDLTGESGFYANVVKMDGAARAKKAIIVPSSGFDSLPFDLTTYLSVLEVKKAAGQDTQVASALCGANIKGSASGGTIASLVSMRDDPQQLEFVRPYWFSPITGVQQAKVVYSRYLPQFKKYGAYTPFTPHNTRIVMRSWGLFQEKTGAAGYGRSFQYVEGFVVPSMIFAYVLSSFFQVVQFLVIHVQLFGALLMRAVPQGSGAPMETQLQGYADVRTLATSEDGKTKGYAVMRFKGDPGYLVTARMISETGLMIALDELAPVARDGGILTPATLGGEVLATRLMKYADMKLISCDASHAEDLSKLLPAS